VPDISLRENGAARQRLGSSYVELGGRIGKMWGWPESLTSAIKIEDRPARSGNHPQAQVRWLACLSNELADLLLYCAPEDWERLCEELNLSAASSPYTSRQLCSALATVRMDLSAIAEVLGLPVTQVGPREESDLVQGQAEAIIEGDLQGPAEPPLARAPDALPQALSGPAAAPTPARTDAVYEPGQVDTQVLSEALMHITEAALLPNAKEVVPQRTLSALFDGLGARRAVLFMRQRGAQLVPVNTVGEALAPSPKVWSVNPSQGQDLFSKLCARGGDTLISDGLKPHIRANLPNEFASAGMPNCFLVLPMLLQGSAIGMIYLDREDGAVFQLNEDNLKLLRMLRNQALAVLR